MLRIRLSVLGLLGVLAMLAASALAATPASAAAQSCNSENARETVPVWCTEKAGVKEDDWEAAMTVTSKNKAGNVAVLEAAGIGFECSGEANTGTITNHGTLGKEEKEETAGTDTTKVTFSGCKVKGDGIGTKAKCVVKGGGGKAGEIITESNSELKVETKEGKPSIVDVFSPVKAGSPFVVIEVENNKTAKCIIPIGNYEVTGQACAETGPLAAKSLLTFSKKIEEACTKAGLSKGLKLGAVEAFLSSISEQALTNAKGEETKEVFGAALS